MIITFWAGPDCFWGDWALVTVISNNGLMTESSHLDKIDLI
jgi:hypothetical protein